MKYIIFGMLILAACTATPELTQEQQEYKDYCMTKTSAWMKMSELHEGKPTGNTCYGCMPNERNHLCTIEEYKQYEMDN